MANTNHSVDRALQVLQLVAELRRPVRFTELVDATGIPKATLHGLLGSLEVSRFLEKTPAGYQIGMTAFEVGAAMPMPSSLREAVAPALDRLAAATGEACHLGILVGTEVVYLDRRDSGEGLRFTTRIGQRLPAHATGLGKAMLALLDDDVLSKRYPERLTRVTRQTLTTRARLFEILREVRDHGYALESEESTPGVCCIGVAVDGPEGPLGLSVTVPVQRASVEDLPRFLPALAEAIEHIGEAARASRWHGIELQTTASDKGDIR
jgi:DNA-binding IclR family transcriptional regulator